MEIRHKEDYTNLLPVFVSGNEQTRALCSSDMDYAAEKAVKAIDKHSITVKPRRRKNKDSKNYQTFRKQKEFNKQLDKCYLLLGKAYFYKKKYAMANNTFRYIQRQYPENRKILTETAIWMFRSLTEMGRFDEAARLMIKLEGENLSRSQRELVQASRVDFYVRQGMYAEAIPEAEKLIKECRNLKRKPRYNFLLSQLYLKKNQEGNALMALKKTVRFNFNYEMVFNAKINMALAYQAGDADIEKKLNKMLRDSRNEEYQDRIYYALGNIEEKRGEEARAVELFWKSVHVSVSNDNQQALSFRKLGDYYFKERDYVRAQSCYDSCMFLMDSRYEDYNQLRLLLTDLTALTDYLRTIQLQDSMLRLASMSVEERNQLIDDKIQEIKDQEEAAREEERRAQAERSFYNRNNMISQGYGYSQGNAGGDWYFYNPVTIAQGKNEFKRKWGRRKLEDYWRRQNKASVEFTDAGEELVSETGGEKEISDTKSREYYLKDIPLTAEAREDAQKKIEEAYYGAGEIYLYKFEDPAKAVECFDAYIKRFKQNNNLPMVYYLAYVAAGKAGLAREAERYKQELKELFPESDFAKGLEDPEYFKKVSDMLKTVEKLYEQAYAKYEGIYYDEALAICDDILKRYPENKLISKVLFLQAMCILNTRSSEEGKAALEEVLQHAPSGEVRSVVTEILTALSAGSRPVAYSGREMAEERLMKVNRNWKFDQEVMTGKSQREEVIYQEDKDSEQLVLIILPETFTLAEQVRFKARMTFIHASEAAEGNNYEMKKEEMWYKQEGHAVRKFENAGKALEYLNRVATDKYILKMMGDRVYRIFVISPANLSVLKRLKKIDDYVDFFAEHYFEDRRQGEILAGKWGTAAHVFHYEENEPHDFVLAVPFREVNVKHIAEILHQVDPAFLLTKEDYDNHLELIVVKRVGAKEQALDYMNAVLKDKELFDRLAGLDYETFIITSQNLKAMQENEYLTQYVKFFDEHYLQSAGEIGVEDGDFIYNKSVEHKFILLYSNSVDPFKLKTVFEEFNFAGLTLSNQKFDEEHDYMIISGFRNKEEAMRYFNTVVSNRKLFKPLRNTDYTNFIVTEVNLKTMLEKKNVEAYLGFFRKYYLD